MKVFKTLIGILIFLLIIFAFAYYYLYTLEVDRVAEARKSYSESVIGKSVKWQGKVLEVDTSDRSIFIQMYEYDKPVEGKRFYAKNDSQSFSITTKVGDWVEIKGLIMDYYNELPVVRSEYFNDWTYMYFDIGVFSPK